MNTDKQPSRFFVYPALTSILQWAEVRERAWPANNKEFRQALNDLKAAIEKILPFL